MFQLIVNIEKNIPERQTCKNSKLDKVFLLKKKPYTHSSNAKKEKKIFCILLGFTYLW